MTAPTRRRARLPRDAAAGAPAVMTRGLETILPLPSASSADNSRFKKRLAVALNSDRANDAALAPPKLSDDTLAGKLTNWLLL